VDEVAKVLPALPVWVSVPILLITLLATLWPKLVQTIRDLSSWDRNYQREKLQLELLKLRYEIEALKKDKGLETLPVSLSAPSPTATIVVPDVRPQTHTRLSVVKRFLYGSSGALIPVALNILLLDSDLLRHYDFVILLGYAFRAVVFLVLAGSASALLSSGQATRANCILTGLSVALLLTVLLTAATARRFDAQPPSAGLTLRSNGRASRAAERRVGLPYPFGEATELGQ
jgi:hypothetical protein